MASKPDTNDLTGWSFESYSGIESEREREREREGPPLPCTFGGGEIMVYVCNGMYGEI